MPLPRLHLVTDDSVLRDARFLERAAGVLERCGTDVALHLRGHATSGRVLHELGEQLAVLALRAGAFLLVNDRIDIAMAIRANGVQLGVRSIPPHDARRLLGHGARIGYSAHGPLESARAASEGADFVLLGTIFHSLSHVPRAPLGIERLQECVHSTGAPVLAIGGVTTARVAPVAASGAYGVAVVSGVWRAADTAAAAAEYLAEIRAAYGATPPPQPQQSQNRSSV
jgi:thiamine-phosphate pyrophosphorylase